MSSGCGDVLSLEDLRIAKLHQIFEAEVITGKQGGVAGGSDIDYATNPVTTQRQKTLPAVLRDAGFNPASFDFATGGTLAITDRNKVVYDPVSTTWYSWAGALPKVIPAGTNPLLDANWRPKTDPNLREELAASDGLSYIGGLTYDGVRAYTGSATRLLVLGRQSEGDGGEGLFILAAGNTSSADDGGVILVDSIGRRWVRSFSGAASALWFGPRTDAYNTLTLALASQDSLWIPRGNWDASEPVVIPRDRITISCDSAARLRPTGQFGFFHIASQYTGQFTTLNNAYFTATASGVGRGITSVDGAYISHWTINNCRFAQNLAYGIRGSLIGLVANKCLFGAIGGANGPMQAVYSAGIVTGNVAATNINTFNDCEFSRMTSTYIIRFENGSKLNLRGCVIEKNTASEAVVRVKGVYYPAFIDSWFEENTSPNLFLLDIETGSGIDSTQMVIDRCLIDSGVGGGYTTAVINWAATQNRSFQLTNTLFARGSGVLTSTGEEPTYSYGNRSTTSGISFIPSETRVANIVSTGGNQIRGVYTLVAGSTAVTTDIRVGAGNGGGMLLVRGSQNDGTSFVQTYIIALRRQGGAGADITAVRTASAPATSIEPLTFSNNGGVLQIARGNNTGTIYITAFL